MACVYLTPMSVPVHPPISAIRDIQLYEYVALQENVSFEYSNGALTSNNTVTIEVHNFTFHEKQSLLSICHIKKRKQVRK
jgi:hypothetical protein